MDKVPVGRRVAALAAFLGLAACNGRIGDLNNGAGSNRSNPNGTDPSLSTGDDGLRPSLASFSCSSGDAPGAPVRLRRLTHSEYERTLRDLDLTTMLGLTANFAQDQELGNSGGGRNYFGNNSDSLKISPVLLESYMDLAKTISETASLPTISSCAKQSPSAPTTCLTDFIQSFGKRCFRRPLTNAEQASYKALFDARFGTEGDFEKAARFVVRAFLSSPKFLHRSEVGSGSSEITHLTGPESAAALSYFLWGTTPDEQLTAAGDNGELDTPDGRRSHAVRLLADPRAKQRFREFAQGWLWLSRLDKAVKDPTVYPGFDDDLKHAMQEETLTLADRAYGKGAGGLAQLFTASDTVVNAGLAKVYDLTGSFASDMIPASLDPIRRAGFLTQPAFLTINAYANGSSPVFRGIFVRRQLLCQEIPPPPPNVPVNATEPKAATTTRERFEQHRRDAFCNSCHHLIDPIGYGFESYDGLGRFRTTDAGKTVDATGEVTDTTGTNGPFDGAVALAKKLSTGSDVTECVTMQMYRFAMGKQEALGSPSEPQGDACVLQAMEKTWREGGSFIDLMSAVVASEAFVTRSRASQDSP